MHLQGSAIFISEDDPFLDFTKIKYVFSLIELSPRAVRVHIDTILIHVHSVQQKSIGLKFSKSRTGSDVRYSCHHNSSRFTFPIFAHSWRFSVFHSLQSITPGIYSY